MIDGSILIVVDNNVKMLRMGMVVTLTVMTIMIIFSIPQ